MCARARVCKGVWAGICEGGVWWGLEGCAASASAVVTSQEFKVGRASPSEGEEREEGGSSCASSPGT